VVFVDNKQRKKVAANSIKITYGGRKDTSKTTSDQTVKTQTKPKSLS
jgi:hypothetical protein